MILPSLGCSHGRRRRGHPRCRGRRRLGGPWVVSGRTGRIDHRDLDPPAAPLRPPSPPSRASRTSVAGSSRDSRKVNETPPVGRDLEVPDHAGGEEVVLEPGILDAGERGGDRGLRVTRSGSLRPPPPASLRAPSAGAGLSIPCLRVTETRCSPWQVPPRRSSRTPSARRNPPPPPCPVRGDVGPQGVEGLLDAVERCPCGDANS